ncbi:MAG: hypothetical protein IH988_07310 [Planctomycetes bacterium]|nr:hypothetical protein [Planctomycetota bacterium]
MEYLSIRTGCGAIIFLLIWTVPVARAQESTGTESSEQEPDGADESGTGGQATSGTRASGGSAVKPSDAPSETDESPAESDDTPRTARQPTVAEILRAFQESERPVLTPIDGVRGEQGSGFGPRGSRDQESGRHHLRLPDGHYLVDRAGWLGQEGPWYTFVFASEDVQDPQPPMKLLPNRMLEWMVREAEGSTEQVNFKVSGEVTDFFGENFLLLRKSLRKRNLGNFKR